MNTSISVIIPTYNRVATLGRALDSVFSQTLPAQDVWIIDDGSTDGTEDYIRSNYPSVNYYYQENAGVSRARNKGAELSQGEWIAFLDSDDEWLAHKLDRQWSEICKDPGIRIVHGNEIWIRNGVRVNQMLKHRKFGGHIFEKCLPLCAISPSAALLQRKLLEEVGGFNENLPACEDYDLWLRICSQYPVSYVDEPILKKYGGHQDQLSQQHWGMDRFRIIALQNIIDSGNLSEQQSDAAINTLISKSTILMEGAKKRDKTEDARDYEKIVNKYTSFFSGSHVA